MIRASNCLVLALVALGLVVCGDPAISHGQANSKPDNAFDVVSVKADHADSSPAQMVIRTPPGGGMTALAVTPWLLIRFAFGLDDHLVLNAPDWIKVARFDVVAKGPAGLSSQTTSEMVRSLLVDRFGLRSHGETRQSPVYALRFARRDRRLGKQIRPSEMACVTQSGEPRPAPRKALPSPTVGLPCGLRMAFGHMSGGGLRLDQVTLALSRVTGRQVIDQTGLAGTVDLVLNFTPESVQLQSDDNRAQTSAALVDPAAPSIFTAIQEQLGLRLEPTQGAIEVLVIDAIGQPTPD